MIKKIHLLILKSFLGPFVITFFVVLFILLMQFLWKYVDDLVGKGLEWFIIVRLLLYVSATLVPLALPLALLLSSLMTFGNLAEHYELVACKSAGMPLQKVMRPLILTAMLICIGAFYFSNNILPIANLKADALLYDVTHQRPALVIKEGVFYNGIPGYVIRIEKKDKDGKTLHNLMIYDHTDNLGNNKMILADNGTMVMSSDERTLVLTLFDGTSHEEREGGRGKRDLHPFLRTKFKQEIIRFDLSLFKMTHTDEALFKDNFQMLNVKQLSTSIDSMKSRIAARQADFEKMIDPFYSFNAMKKNDTATLAGFRHQDFLDNFDGERRKFILLSAISTVRNAKDFTTNAMNDIIARQKNLYKNEIEWNRKFTLSFACLVLFFIGAPLGAIIRKGGLGMPAIVSVVLFLVFHVISITGEKFVREGVLPASKGMWIASVVLLPVGVFLTYKATTDSKLFDIDSYKRFFDFFLKKKNFKEA